MLVVGGTLWLPELLGSSSATGSCLTRTDFWRAGWEAFLSSLPWVKPVSMGRYCVGFSPLRHQNHLSPSPLSVEQARLQLRLPAQLDLEGGALVAGGEVGDRYDT